MPKRTLQTEYHLWDKTIHTIWTAEERRRFAEVSDGLFAAQQGCRLHPVPDDRYAQRFKAFVRNHTQPRIAWLFDALRYFDTPWSAMMREHKGGSR